MNRFTKAVLFALRLYRFYRAPNVEQAVAGIQKLRDRLHRVAGEQGEVVERLQEARDQLMQQEADLFHQQSAASDEATKAKRVAKNIEKLLEGGA